MTTKICRNSEDPLYRKTDKKTVNETLEELIAINFWINLNIVRPYYEHFSAQRILRPYSQPNLENCKK